MGSFFQAFVQADAFGKLIFFALLALSILSWSFLIYKICVLIYVKKQAKRFSQAIEKHRDCLLNVHISLPAKPPFFPIPYPYLALYTTLKKKTTELLDKNHYFHLRAKSALQHNYLSHADIEMLDAHLHTAMIEQKEQLERNVCILSTVEKLAPFLGLLGTVWGIFLSFSQLQGSQNASSHSALLGGLSTALTTTVLGLLIAIPALIALTYIQNLNHRFSIEMRNFSHFLLSTIELQYRKVDVQ